MTEQKSKEKTIMDKMVQECKNSYQSIKMSSLDEESKDKIIKTLRKERKKRFNQDDYQRILQKVLDEDKIPAKDLYDIVIELMYSDLDVTISDLLDGGDVFVEYVNDEITKIYGKKYTKKMPRTLQDLKKSLIPFDVTDENFAMFLLGGEDINYKGQKLNLGYEYDKLLKEKNDIENKIRTEYTKEIEKNEQLKKWNNEINEKSKSQRECRMANQGPQGNGACRYIDEEIEKIQKNMEIEKYTILHNIKEKYGYDDIISKIKTYEELAFREKYNYLRNLYNTNIRRLNLDNINENIG